MARYQLRLSYRLPEWEGAEAPVVFASDDLQECRDEQKRLRDSQGSWGETQLEEVTVKVLPATSDK